MNKIFISGLFFASLHFSLPFAAAGEHEHSHQHSMHQDPVNRIQGIDGVVRKVDMKRLKVTMKHGEIKQIEMPAMVMNYNVTDSSLLAGVMKGDKVRFSMDRVDGKYVITHIEHVK